MKRGKIHWITQNIKVGIETRKLIRYPLFMRRKELLPLAFGGESSKLSVRTRCRSVTGQAY